MDKLPGKWDVIRVDLVRGLAVPLTLALLVVPFVWIGINFKRERINISRMAVDDFLAE